MVLVHLAVLLSTTWKNVTAHLDFSLMYLGKHNASVGVLVHLICCIIIMPRGGSVQNVTK